MLSCDQEEIIADKEHVDEANSSLNGENMRNLQNSAPSENLEAAREVSNVADPSNGLETSQVSIPPVVSS